MAKYSLLVQNASRLPGPVCVYTTSPDTQAIQKNLRSLAWFTKNMIPGTQAKFMWDLDFSFAWAETGELVTGVHFEAGQIIHADPQTDDHKALFCRANEAYVFGDPSRADNTPAGALGISTDGSIPNGHASIGIGINGKAALAVLAAPNYRFTFFPKVKYYVAFGNFKEGVVLDLNVMTRQVREIAFPLNVYNMQVTLQEDNTWSAPQPA